jgi:hypothetical protein
MVGAHRLAIWQRLDNSVLFGWRYMVMEFENEGVETDVTNGRPDCGSAVRL